jgi:hypothetical protein
MSEANGNGNGQLRARLEYTRRGAMRYFASFLLIALLAVSVGRMLAPVASMATEEDAQLRCEGASSGHRYPDFGCLPPPSQYEGDSHANNLAESYRLR